MLEHVEPDQPGQFITDRQIVYIGPDDNPAEEIVLVHREDGSLVVIVGTDAMPSESARRIADQCAEVGSMVTTGVRPGRKYVLDAISNTLRPISGYRHIHPEPDKDWPEPVVTSDEGPDTRPPATGAEAGAGA